MEKFAILETVSVFNNFENDTNEVDSDNDKFRDRASI